MKQIHENPLWKTFHEILQPTRLTTHDIWELYKQLDAKNILAIIDAIRDAQYKARMIGYKEGAEE